jgi:hypothetical protein
MKQLIKLSSVTAIAGTSWVNKNFLVRAVSLKYYYKLYRKLNELFVYERECLGRTPR